MKKIIAVMAVLITLFSMGNVSASAAAKVAALMYHSVTTDSTIQYHPNSLTRIYNTLKAADIYR